MKEPQVNKVSRITMICPSCKAQTEISEVSTGVYLTDRDKGQWVRFFGSLHIYKCNKCKVMQPMNFKEMTSSWACQKTAKDIIRSEP